MNNTVCEAIHDEVYSELLDEVLYSLEASTVYPKISICFSIFLTLDVPLIDIDVPPPDFGTLATPLGEITFKVKSHLH